MTGVKEFECLLTQIRQHAEPDGEKPELPLSLRCDDFMKHSWKHRRNYMRSHVVLIMQFHRPAREFFKFPFQTSIGIGVIESSP